MALATGYHTPNPKFDPSKYGRNSAARTANLTKTVSLPKIEAPATIPPTQSLITNALAKETALFPVKKTDTEIVTTALESTCLSEIKHTSSDTVGVTEESKPTAISEVEFQQSTSFGDLVEHATSGGEETKPALIPELKVQDAALIPVSETERIKPGTPEIPPYPTTLITAEHFDLNSIPAPDEAESNQSSATGRLVSLRHIRNICHVKVENRWLTLAQVDEWTCTVPRHAFQVGELVVYVQVDAFLSASDKRFGLMSSLQTFDGDLGHRIKTRRFGSYPDKLTVQGNLYPIEKFEEIFREIKCIRQTLSNVPNDTPSEEKVKQIVRIIYRKEDWAARLGVKKWEEPEPVNKPNRHPRLGAIPTRVFKKTDITYFEDCPNLFTKGKYFTHEYQESIKMDGASMTVYFVKKATRKYHDLNELPKELGPHIVHTNGRFGVASKTVDLNELSTCVFGYWTTALKNDLPAKLSKLDRSIAIQGEICGPGINQNREKLEETQFFVYSMWDIASQKYIDPRKVEALARKLELKHVPVLGYVKIRDIASNHKELRDRANERPGEGLVYKCVHDGRSFKVHSSAYKVLHNC